MDNLQAFPCALVPSGSTNLVEVIKEKQQLIDDLLLQSGAVLFRGFSVNSASDFEQVVGAFDYEAHDFSGGAWLIANGPRVSSALGVPSSVPLNYHNEGAYLRNPPSKMMLYCDVEPAAGEGATTLLNGHALYTKMLELFPEFVQQLEEKQLIYGRKLEEHTWKTMFGADDKEEVEKRAKGMDSSIEWVSKGCAEWYSKPRSGVVMDEARGGRKVWFNAIASMMDTFETLGSLAPVFGDGTPLPRQPLEACQMMMKKLEAPVSWKRGDVLLIDNVATMHAKQACSSNRSIFIALAA